MANIIIVGCGRVGSELATLLSQNDGNVCVVDRNAEAFSNLSRNFNGTTLQGLGFDEDVLIRAGVEEADVVAAVTQSDNSNLDTFGDFEILRFSLDLSVVGMKFARVSELERSHGIRIVAFERRDGSASSIPTKDGVLYHGDSVLACVRHDLLGSFSKYMQM